MSSSSFKSNYHLQRRALDEHGARLERHQGNQSAVAQERRVVLHDRRTVDDNALAVRFGQAGDKRHALDDAVEAGRVAAVVDGHNVLALGGGGGSKKKSELKRYKS